MIFMVFCSDKPNALVLREEIRPAHREYIREPGKVSVIFGGPTLGGREQSMNGTLLIVEADTDHQVRDFLAGDPYFKAQLFSSVEIRPWQGIPLARNDQLTPQ